MHQSIVEICLLEVPKILSITVTIIVAIFKLILIQSDLSRIEMHDISGFFKSEYKNISTRCVIVATISLVLILIGDSTLAEFIIYPLLVYASTNRKIQIKYKSVYFVVITITTIIVSILCEISQSVIYTHVSKVYNNDTRWIVINIILYALLFSLINLIIGKIHISSAIFCGIVAILSLANTIVVNQRGVSLQISDFTVIDTVLSVSNRYNLSIPSGYLCGLSLIIMGLILSCRFTANLNKTDKNTKIINRLASFVVIYLGIMGLIPFMNSTSLHNIEIEPLNFNEQNYGLMVNLFSGVVYSRLEEPDNYKEFKDILIQIENGKPIGDVIQEINPDNTDKIYGKDIYEESISDRNSDAVLLDTTKEYTTDLSFLDNNTAEKPENIIVIMRESFFDPQKLPVVSFEEDSLPITRSMQNRENTITGNLYTPSLGGGTANTEYEVLTGNSLETISGGVYPYQSYIKTKIPSFINELNANGYNTNSLHTYKSGGYNRLNVYKLMGFENSYFDDSFDTNSTITSRGYIVDKEGYKFIAENIISKDEPTFTFFVTMQGHGGWDNYPTQEEIENYPNYKIIDNSNYPKDNASKYQNQSYNIIGVLASEIYNADISYGEFIDYIDSLNERTLVVSFGDHQSGVIYSGKNLSGKVTPLVIHANYYIPSQNNILISSNYLSALISKVGNLETTKRTKLSLELYKILPIFNSMGFVGDNQRVYSKYTLSKTDYIKAYNIIHSLGYGSLEDNDYRFYWEVTENWHSDTINNTNITIK